MSAFDFEVELGILESALSQGDWEVERLPEKEGLPPELVQVSSFRIVERTLFISIIEHKPGVKTLLEIEIRHFVLREDYDPKRAAETQYARRIVVADVSADKKIADGEYWQKIDTTGGIGVALVRSADAPPGWPIDAEASYGYGEHIKRYGDDSNLLRTEHVAQPRALKPGDILATGEHVLSLPRAGYNGSVLIHMTSGTNGHWISMAARLPIALLARGDVVPLEMWTFR